MKGLVVVLLLSNLLFSEDFGEFLKVKSDRDYSYKLEKDFTKKAPKNLIEIFQVRNGDCYGWDCKNPFRERSEKSEKNKVTKNGDVFWYGWSIYFPEDFKDIFPVSTTLGQFHQLKSYPVWMFRVDKNRFGIFGNVKDKNKKNILVKKFTKLIDMNELRGKWHKIEINVKWSKKDNGFMKIYINGDLKYNYRGITMTADKIYFKYGIYRSYLKPSLIDVNNIPTQIVYYSNVKRAKNRDRLRP